MALLWQQSYIQLLVWRNVWQVDFLFDKLSQHLLTPYNDTNNGEIKLGKYILLV